MRGGLFTLRNPGTLLMKIADPRLNVKDQPSQRLAPNFHGIGLLLCLKQNAP